MKKLVLFTILAGLMACQPAEKQRYFTESPEIDMAKAIIEGYLADDFSTHKTTYAESAEIHHNTMESISLDQLIEGFNANSEALTSKEFVDPIYEMVIDGQEETWVLFWSEWKAELANGKSVSVPVHVAWRFADGKIDREWAYYDNAIMNAAMAEEIMEEEKSEDDGEETDS